MLWIHAIYNSNHIGFTGSGTNIRLLGNTRVIVCLVTLVTYWLWCQWCWRWLFHIRILKTQNHISADYFRSNWHIAVGISSRWHAQRRLRWQPDAFCDSYANTWEISTFVNNTRLSKKPRFIHWKPWVEMIPTLPSKMAPADVVITLTTKLASWLLLRDSEYASYCMNISPQYHTIKDMLRT